MHLAGGEGQNVWWGHASQAPRWPQACSGGWHIASPHDTFYLLRKYAESKNEVLSEQKYLSLNCQSSSVIPSVGGSTTIANSHRPT